MKYDNIYDLFDEIRNNDYGETDIYKIIKKYSKNFESDILKKILYDLSYYLFTEREEMIAKYSFVEVLNAINEREKQGLEIPKIKGIPFEKLTEKQRKLQKEKDYNLTESTIDIESLLFPFEFYSLYKLKNFLTKFIKNDDEENNIITEKIKLKGSLQSIGYLFTKLIENGFIEAPKRSENINKTATAKMILEHFEFVDKEKQPNEEDIRKTLFEDNKLSFDKQNLFKIPTSKQINTD